MGENANLEQGRILGKIWNTLITIRSTLYRYRRTMNIKPYFEAYDPRNEGVLSYPDFVNVLFLNLQQDLGLSKTQVHELAEFFKANDGRVMYRRFLECIDLGQDEYRERRRLCDGNELNDLQASNVLSDDEETHLRNVLNEIAGRVFAMNTSLKVVFREYEVVQQNRGVMPISQLASALDFLKIRLNENDFYIIVKKYLCHDFLVNFALFAEDVEDRINELTAEGRIMDYFYVDERNVIDILPECKVMRLDPQHDVFMSEPALHPAMRQIPFDESALNVFRQVQYTINRDRINIQSFFRDLDPIHTGNIPVEQFIRVITTSGIQAVNVFSEIELRRLADLYRLSSDPCLVNYRQFLEDLVRVREPDDCLDVCTYPSIIDVGKKTHIRGNYYPHTTHRHRNACESALIKIQKYLKERHITLAERFKDEDRLHTGHVSLFAFRQALDLANAQHYLDVMEMKGLNDRYIDAKGVNYRMFLEEIHENLQYVVPTEKDPPSLLFNDQPSTSYQKITRPPPIEFEGEVLRPSEVLNNLKVQVRKVAVDVTRYIQQFNFLRESFIPIGYVWRGLENAGIKITKRELDAIEKMFGTPYRKGVIDIENFLETIYSNEFQPRLEKAPLHVPVVGMPILDGRFNAMNYIERKSLQKIMRKLATKAEFFIDDLFREFDRYGFGILLKKDFPRALSYLGRGIEYMVNQKERDLIFKAFSRIHGKIQGLDYKAFCQAVRTVRDLNPL